MRHENDIRFSINFENLYYKFIIYRETFIINGCSYKSTRDILKVGMSFQNLYISTNNLTHVLCIRKHNHFLVRLKMEYDKEHFRYYFSVLI